MAEQEKSSELVTVATYNDVLHANIMKSKLEAYGIQCFLEDENMSTILYTQAFGGIKLQVSEADAEQALEVLNEEQGVAEHEKVDAVVCPFCSSSDVELKSNHPNIFVAMGALFMNSLPLNKKVRYYCKNCKKSFTKQAQ